MVLKLKDIFKKAIEENTYLGFQYNTNEKLTKKQKRMNETTMFVLSYLDDDTDFGITVAEVNKEKGYAIFEINSDAVKYIYNEIEKEIKEY